MIGLGGMGNRWGLFLIAIFIVLMLHNLIIIVINDGVYMVDKMNVLCLGLLLTVMKT